MFKILKPIKFEYETKVVRFFEYNIEVPLWTRYLAVDSDGMVYAYDSKPFASSNEWVQNSSSEQLPIEILTVRYEGNWRESLVVIETIYQMAQENQLNFD